MNAFLHLRPWKSSWTLMVRTGRSTISPDGICLYMSYVSKCFFCLSKKEIQELQLLSLNGLLARLWLHVLVLHRVFRMTMSDIFGK